MPVIQSMLNPPVENQYSEGCRKNLDFLCFLLTVRPLEPAAEALPFVVHIVDFDAVIGDIAPLVAEIQIPGTVVAVAIGISIDLR